MVSTPHTTEWSCMRKMPLKLVHPVSLLSTSQEIEHTHTGVSPVMGKILTSGHTLAWYEDRPIFFEDIFFLSPTPSFHFVKFFLKWVDQHVSFQNCNTVFLTISSQ